MIKHKGFNAWMTLLALSLACSFRAPQTSDGSVRVVGRETPLDKLNKSERVLAIVDAYSQHEGIFWLDLDNHTLHLAKQPKVKSALDGKTYDMIIEPGMTRWTGETFIYGDRLSGFFSLASDNSVRQLSDYGYIGSLADNGRQILRFFKCGPDGQSSGWEITPLDLPAGESGYCFISKNTDRADAWVSVVPIWNTYLPRVDFIVSERLGRGSNITVQSTKLMRAVDGGGLVEIADLGVDFRVNECCTVIPRPDGGAYLIADRTRGAVHVIDSGGSLLADLSVINEQFPELEMSLQVSWAPDSRQAILAFRDKGCRGDCPWILIHASNDFQSFRKLIALPPEMQHARTVIWSPDSAYAAIVADIHDGAGFPPRILTINLQDGSTADYVLRFQSILRDVHWVR